MPEGRVLPDEFWAPPSDKFIGKITSITIRRMSIGDELQDRIVLEIEDFSPTRDAPRSCWFPPKNTPRSKWGRWGRELRLHTGLSVERTQDILGQCFEFDLIEWWAGTDYATTVPIPLRHIPDEETARNEAMQLAVETGLISAEQLETEGAKKRYMQDLILSHLEGKTYGKFLQSVLGEPDIADNDELMAKLAEPKHAYIQEEFVDKGLVSLSADGIYSLVPGPTTTSA